MILLKDRSIIEVSGPDRQDFLQGLITNDIKLIHSSNIIYTAFLNSAGRFFADFFIFEKDEKYFIDCHLAEVDELIKKFNLYKLRSQIEIEKNQDLRVVFNLEKLGYQDPRINDFGYRLYVNSTDLASYQLEDVIYYHRRRIDFKLPEGYYDLTKDKSYIAEFGFDNLSAVSYKKGCYIGQEATARNHYRGQVRKRIFPFTISNIDKNLQNFLDLNSLQIEDGDLKLCNLKNLEIFNKNLVDCAENSSVKNDLPRVFSGVFSGDLPEVLLGSSLDTSLDTSLVGVSFGPSLGIFLSTILDKNTKSLFGLALVKTQDFTEKESGQELNDYFNKILKKITFQENIFLITS